MSTVDRAEATTFHCHVMQKQMGHMFSVPRIAAASRAISAGAAKALVAAEVAATEFADEITADMLAIVGSGTNWRVVLRPSGGRVDEAQCATVSEIGRKVALNYSIEPA